MADVHYWISEVCYNSQNTHIVQVKIYPQGKVSPGNGEIWPRESVVNYLENGYNIYTMTYENGKWVSGAKVKIVNIRGIKYIKTVADATTKDNLGDLARFNC
ncbi:MAG: DUF3892 domain-containing protein [Spirochaetales bacterium]|jgi:hypothetical protein|nr:DUF3892 domain-containing protein [Spirochaetales bacterium]